MNDRSDTGRVLKHWFDDGPTRMPDRVLDVVADRISHVSQRRAWRLLGREGPMNAYTKLALGAAAVVAIIVAGSIALPRLVAQVGGPKPLVEIVARFDAATLGLDRPVDLAVAPNGHLYVTESNDRVTELTPDGQIVRRWGRTGSGPGEFDFTGLQVENGAYASITVAPDGKVYVSDSDNHRVEVFSPDGSFIRQFGGDGSIPGQFGLAYDLVVDTAGNVYVLDDILQRLTKFGPSGEVLWTVSGVADPTIRGHLHSPHLDAAGRVVVGNDDNGRVAYIDPSGRVVDSFDADGCTVTIDAADNLYVGPCDHQWIQVFDPAHHLIATWSPTTLEEAPEFAPNGVAFGLTSDGTILKLRWNLPAH